MEAEKTMKITWLGHSCFQVESDGYAVVFDPYEDGYVPGLRPLRVKGNLVLCSHNHGDHNAVQTVDLLPVEGCPFTVKEIPTFHDDQGGTLRGENRIHILDNGSLRIAHLGDLGCDLDPEQEKALLDLDAVMIPVGGFYTIDAVQAKHLVDRIRPRVVIPMHYRSERFGFDVLGTLEDFTEQCELVAEYPGDSLELTKETRSHIAVLKLPDEGSR